MNAMTELEAADSYCRYLANRHYENFTVASLILPSRLRVHLARIYAFCRTTDDLGDESDHDALARLALWREQVIQSGWRRSFRLRSAARPRRATARRSTFESCCP